MPSKYDDMKVSDIKACLKKVGMSQVGDKGTMIHRLDLFHRCDSKKLTVKGDQNPCLLKGNDLKHCASKLGISPMLTPDEMLTDLVALLEATMPSASSSSANSNGDENSAEGKSGKNVDAVGIAKLVLELSELDDYEVHN